jgi:hypothetical protein
VTELIWSIFREKPLVVRGILPTAKSREDYTYIIDEWGTNQFKYERKDGIAVGPIRISWMKGEATTYDEARATLEQDWLNLQRLQSWLNYMLNNPPPS